MNRIKVAVVMACCLLGALLSLVIIAQNPQQALYKKTVNTMMAYEGWSSEKQALDHSPELKDINAKMEQIARLNSAIHGMTAGPTPNLSREEINVLEDYREEIKMLQTNVNDQLVLLMATYTRDVAHLTEL